MRPLVNFRQLETLRAIFQTGSVTGAAERLSVTQPAVSHTLRDVEERIGFRLFDRELGRLTPTRKGQLLWQEIQKSFVAFESINGFCRRLAEVEERDVVLSSVPIVSTAILPQAIRRYRDEKGPRYFRIRPQDTVNAITSVRFRTADMSIGVNLAPVPGVEHADIATYDLVCFLPPGHEAGRKPFVTIADVVGIPFISLSDLEGIAPSIHEALPEAAGALRVSVECPSAITAVAMVEAGLGFTLLDPISSYIYRRSSVQVRPFRPAVRNTMRAYWQADEDDHFDRAFFLDLMRERTAEIVESGPRTET